LENRVAHSTLIQAFIQESTSNPDLFEGLWCMLFADNLYS